MCGIALIVTQKEDDTAAVESLLQETERSLSRRGPDSYRVHTVQAAEHTLHLAGAVLHIQGESILTQPHMDEAGNILLWNGEVWGSTDGTLSLAGRAAAGYAGTSDTVLVASMLAAAADGGDDNVVAAVLANIYGPFAFVFLHAASQRLFYGRDPFGRRCVEHNVHCVLRTVCYVLCDLHVMHSALTLPRSLCPVQESLALQGRDRANTLAVLRRDSRLCLCLYCGGRGHCYCGGRGVNRRCACDILRQQHEQGEGEGSALPYRPCARVPWGSLRQELLRF